MIAEAEKYTYPPIQGCLPEKILPSGCALVLEGGGTRGFYSAGVFEAFLDAGIMVPLYRRRFGRRGECRHLSFRPKAPQPADC